MTNFEIELDGEMVDKIVVDRLRDTWNSYDPVADDAEIQKRMDALELILKWYATPEQLKDMGLADDVIV